MLLQRSYWLFRYHHKIQFARRVFTRISIPIRTVCFALRSNSDFHWDLPEPKLPTFRTDQKLRFGTYQGGTLTLLNIKEICGEELEWDRLSTSPLPPLWKFHLHYQEYLVELANRDPSLVWSTITRWLDSYPIPNLKNTKLAWHPYVISRRLGVWLELVQTIPPSPKLLSRVLNSLFHQVRWLSANLERDIGGNHLWENAQALILAGYFFSGKDANHWKKLGMDLLDNCLQEQILPSGEHYERSPSYHLQLTEGLYLLHECLKICGEPKAFFYHQIAKKMEAFSSEISHPDLSLPLFGDSTAVFTKELAKGPTNNWVGEYFVHRRPEVTVIFDAGQMGPDELPAHSHADLLGFESSIWGSKLFVDSGAYCYTGPKRDQYRSTKAHNTLSLEGVELADFWGSFRMGRRGHVIERFAGEVNEGSWVSATHDAYRPFGIKKVTRFWFFAKSPCAVWSIFIVENIQGTKEMTERLHLHPSISPIFGSTSCHFNLGEKTTFFQPLPSSLPFFQKASTYSPDFYVEEASSQLVLKKQVREGVELATGWVLSLSPPVTPASVELEGKDIILRFHHQDQRYVRITGALGL